LVDKAGIKSAATKGVLAGLCAETDKFIAGIEKVEKASEKGEPLVTLAAMEELRASADELEIMIPAELWPLPTYAEMMFMI
jgi:glutamine synthetase